MLRTKQRSKYWFRMMKLHFLYFVYYLSRNRLELKSPIDVSEQNKIISKQYVERGVREKYKNV